MPTNQAFAAELFGPLGADEPGLLQFGLPLLICRMLSRLGPAFAAVTACGHDVVPVGELGQARRRMPGNPAPRFGAEPTRRVCQ